MSFIEELPVVQEFSKLEDAWKITNNYLLKAPTGSGKSIGLPWMLFKKNMIRGQVLVVQPRRIAAISLARKLSELINTPLGSDVGYQVRFDKRYVNSSRIIYVTDGILFRLLLNDNNLSRIGLIIFDEFHERTLQIDASLALVKQIQKQQRPHLRILVTSATLDLDSISSYLPNSSKLTITGKAFPVEIQYKSTRDDLSIWKQIEQEAERMMKQYIGDLLIFMDGASSVNRVAKGIQKQRWAKDVNVCRLFGEMPDQEQDEVLKKGKRRKIIISTNIAETSLTLPGITMVIDSGIAKIASFDSVRNVNCLLTKKISKSSADQRAGRAGRISPGFCLRLWSEADHKGRPDFQVSEIKRLDLSELSLSMHSRKKIPQNIDWFENPEEDDWAKAKNNLIELKLLSNEGEVTPLGKKISDIPLQPKFSTSLYYAEKEGCLSELALILSIIDGRSPFTDNLLNLRENNQRKYSSDLNLILEKYLDASRSNFDFTFCFQNGIHQKRILSCKRIAEQLCSYFSVQFLPKSISHEKIARILIGLYPDHVVHLKSAGQKLYENSKGQNVKLSPSSSLKNSDWAIPLLITEKNFKGKITLQMDFVTEIKPEWILDILSNKIKKVKSSYLDLDSRNVIVESYWSLGVHKIKLKSSFETNQQDIAHAYAKAIVAKQINLKNWDSEVDQFFNRLKFISNNFPEYKIPSLNNDELVLILEQICFGKKSWKEIRNIEVKEHLEDYIGADTKELIDKIAPPFFVLSKNSKKVFITYSTSEARMKIPLQDLYDEKSHPSLMNGAYPIIVEILAPNNQVVQITKNAPEFWNNSYQQIKKDLAGRYPKHEWR